MTQKRLRTAVTAATLASIAALAMGVSAIAPASETGSAATAPNGSTEANNPAADFSVFNEPLASADALEQSRLRQGFTDAPGSFAKVNFDLARPAEIQGTAAKAWIAPAAGKVCLFVPDPVDGYGASCSTAADIKAGRAIAVLGGGAGGSGSDVIVAALVPDNGSPPEVISGANTTAMRVSSNVAAAVLPASAKARNAAGTIDLSLFGPSSTR